MAPHNDAPSHTMYDSWGTSLPLQLSPLHSIYAAPQFNNSFSSTSIASDDHSHRLLVPGIYVPTPAFFTPRTEDLDTKTVAHHAVRLAQAGVAGIATQGSNGEAVHLTHNERNLITKTTRKALDDAGFESMPIIAGCGAQSTRETIELCNDAYHAGADAALVLPPSYYGSLYTPSSTQSFFEDVAGASPIPILIYNFPGAVSGIDLSSDTIIALAKHPNIVGCKLTCGNTGKLARIAAATNAATPSSPGSGFLCLGGSADFTLPTLIAGGSGIICGLGNVAPKACVEVMELYSSGKVAEAQKLQTVVAKGDWVAIRGGVVGTKSALESYFGYGGYGRKPLPRPTKQENMAWAEGFKELVAKENALQSP